MKELARLTATLLYCLTVSAGVASAQAGERLTDKDVQALIETVDNGRDRFEDQLDGKLKATIVRSPSGEVNVARFLDDLQENTGRLKDRFTPEYAASAEVAAVLRQSTAIHAFMRQKPGIKGGSEWDQLAAHLSRLAGVYGTKFPLEGDAPVRRITDGEAARAADTIAQQADQFKNAVNREQALAKPAKDELKAQADLVKNAAKSLKSRLNDSKPATSEARQVMEAIRKMRGAAKGLTPASLSLIGQMQAPLATLGQAFAITVPAATT
jgi:hypothetical protein